MDNYVLLYGDKKVEDNIVITNMFENSRKINLGWTDFDFTHNWNIIEEEIKKHNNQIIFMGLEIGWDKLIIKIKENYPNLKVKVICNTQDSLLYYDYERENFFRLLELSKENKVDDIVFLRKGQYTTYSSIGIKCSYLLQNFSLKEKKQIEKDKNGKINIGIYPLNYVWDKNIFNQLCISKFIDNSNLNYNNIDPRMKEFLDTMNITNTEDSIKDINVESLIEKISKNNVVISCSFTEYLHPVFFISMELGIPCLIGNNSDLFKEDDELKQFVVTNAEDNPIINSDKVIKLLENSEKVQQLYLKWKEKYNIEAEKRMEEFINK